MVTAGLKWAPEMWPRAGGPYSVTSDDVPCGNRHDAGPGADVKNALASAQLEQ
ncbi:MAG TPA: hypothetical protein VHQ90_18050 [Thermoanaerobaculia bacterium]|nr:hypothetical protein [Thermoanaerobaculia bacterium]